MPQLRRGPRLVVVIAKTGTFGAWRSKLSHRRCLRTPYQWNSERVLGIGRVANSKPLLSASSTDSWWKRSYLDFETVPRGKQVFLLIFFAQEVHYRVDDGSGRV